jgi:hypothetical protein
MKRSRFSQEQIIAILREQEVGVGAVEVCRKHGISRTTFYRWRRKCAGLDVSDTLPLTGPEDENTKLGSAPLPGALLDQTGSSHRWMHGSGLNRLLTNVLGFHKATRGIDKNGTLGWGWLPYLTLNSSFALIATSSAYIGGRANWPWATDLYWAALVGLFLPVAIRVAWPAVSRQERIGLIILLGTALYLVKVLQSPAAFIQFDELLHVPTATAILDEHRLFSLNSLLPISPFYPGMEIATTAIANLTGLSIFLSGVLLLAVARVVVVLSLFLLFERISGSSWIAALACLIYMGHSGFLLFHAMFAYESLAFAFLTLLLLSEAFTASLSNYRTPLLFLTLPLLCALAVTHHVTSWFAAVLLLGLASAHFAYGSSPTQKWRAAAVGCLALVTCLGWSQLMGNPVEGYLGPVFESGWQEFYQLVTGQSLGRKLFVAEDGSGLPIWQRLTTLVATGLTCIGLAIGFFRALALRDPANTISVRRPPFWAVGIGNNARSVLLTILTIGFPASVLLRFTRAGWEVGNRAGAFVFLGVSLVGAVGIVYFWLAGSKSRPRSLAVGVALTILFIGGAISGSALTAVPTRYKVSADALSIEPLGVATATWTREKLGDGWRFAADRVNRLLLATYGRQRLITTLQDKIDISGMLLGERLSDEDLYTITSGKVDFLLIDLRLGRALPLVGVYFEQGEDPRLHAAPPSTKALLKFNQQPGVSRIFDGGPILIYDVRSLHADK